METVDYSLYCMKIVGQTHDRLGHSCPNQPKYQYSFPSSLGGTFSKTTCGKHTPAQFRKPQYLIVPTKVARKRGSKQPRLSR